MVSHVVDKTLADPLLLLWPKSIEINTNTLPHATTLNIPRKDDDW